MTNTAGHSDRRAHCSPCPDGPWNKSAQAETDFQYKDIGATACLQLLQPHNPALSGRADIHICTAGVGMGGWWWMCEREKICPFIAS